MKITICIEISPEDIQKVINGEPIKVNTEVVKDEVPEVEVKPEQIPEPAIEKPKSSLREYHQKWLQDNNLLKSRDKVCKCGNDFHDDSPRNNRRFCGDCKPKIDLPPEPTIIHEKGTPVVLKTGWKMCRYKLCKAPFKPAKFDQQYCSIKCEANDKLKPGDHE